VGVAGTTSVNSPFRLLNGGTSVLRSRQSLFCFNVEACPDTWEM